MIIKYNIKDFRKDFNKNFPGFYLRIREDSNDIAYYNGIKAFEIKKEADKINLFFPINTYKCNPTNVKNNKNINKEFKTLLKPMTTFFDFNMTKIKFKKAGKYNEKITRECLLKFKEHTSNIIDFDIEEIINQLNNIDYQKEQQLKKDNKTKETTISIKINNIKDINNIIDLQYHFINDLRIKETKDKENNLVRSGNNVTCRDIEFEYTISDKKNNNKLETYDKSKLIPFKNTIKKTIINYENQTTINSEKKYQHQFMLNQESNKHSNIYAFEEEYYIKEKNDFHTSEEENEKNGRIDCILYKMEDKVLTDIYLIELKVNSKVIAKDNGVLTHLDDIKNLINKTNFKKQTNKDFFYKLKKRINYRLSELNDFELLNKDFSIIDYNIHFYTIVAYTEPFDKNKQEVIEYFNLFNTKEGVNKLIENNDLDNKFKDKSIYDIINSFKDKRKCELKFIFDENVWDETNNIFNPNYKEVTSYYFKGIKNEQN